MRTKKALLSLVLASSVCSGVYARENIGSTHGSVKRALATGCAVDAGSAYMQINNIRARIMDEGDMWWDPGAGLPRYYVPAGSNTCSLFAGALWVGGVDAGGQLKVAAMTYRQNGEDFWTGPIYSGFQISPAQCLQWDKLFYVTRQEVDNWAASPQGPVPADIANWPGNDPADGSMLAPYHDGNGDHTYDPTDGTTGNVDYPAYDLAGTATTYKNQIFGDATLWWVINDIGNTHTESSGIAIGLEVREQCFAFQTNDAINNMTFYNYEIINKSSYQVNNTYFGAWVDPDLGNGGDDFVGCDVGRSMGYCYNGECDDPDGSGQFAGEIGYHNDPPAIGAVFFQGPAADAGNHSCYTKIVDSVNTIGMARFVYYNNDFTVQGNPTKASDYYNYLRGIWEDGSTMTYGGNGYQTSATPTSYMFDWTPGGACSSTPVNTDPTGCGTNGVVQTTEWDEVKAGDPYGDRRFMQSAGPFTLAPGAVNYVTVGMVWDQPANPNECNIAPICLIQQDADLAQALFNNHFKVLDGPDAPDLNIQELNRELIITITNKQSSNNYLESYNQVSPTIISSPDNTYKFEGYEIFQVLDSAVSATQLLDPTQARLVAECDVKNGVGTIINYVKSSTTGLLTPTLEVSGQDKGIVHSFDIKTDQFQQDNISTLVNDRPYYYIAIAYAYNQYKPYNPADTTTDKGQLLPFLQGRKNIKVYHGFPHIPTAQAGGTIQNSTYGEGPAITRLAGHGNGTNVLELDPASENYILLHDTMANPTYLPGHGPINVKVVDPLSVVDANFVLTIHPATGTKGVNGRSWWELDDITRGWKFYSDVTIGTPNEQIFPQYGISISIDSIPYPSGKHDGVIDSACSVTFADNTKQWLGGVPSAGPGTTPLFWIRSGTNIDRNCTDASAFNSYPVGTTGPCPSQTQVNFYDANQFYNQILGGVMAPFALCAQSDAGLYVDNGPGYNCMDSIANMASVDIVITSDQSKWTRCIVLEEQDETVLAEGNAKKLDPRASESVDKNGNYATPGSGYSSDPTAPNYIAEKGMGWFPGYTINIETGERLNMAFGEDSWLSGHNGRDMKWNPDSVVAVQDASGATGAAQLFGISSVFGGKHYIYVFAHNNNQNGKKYNIPAYDKDSTILSILSTITPATLAKSNVLGDIMWAGIPLLKQGHSILECDAYIHLRVAKPYDTNYGSTTVDSKITGSAWANANNPTANYPAYGFSTNGIAAVVGSDSTAKSALDLINIVPNPYYAYSSYENNRLDNRVRITNLPPVCTISIFSLNGTLIDVIQKNDPTTYADWTLENQYSIPISSGMYLIHIFVPNVGQVTLKWFGVMRPTDLNSY
ncbi:MAG TPA: hypothetical protein VK783_14885 [Bacteroidia bacterium]|nr:hypothetical protein [Bacteroidia bacterium]